MFEWDEEKRISTIEKHGIDFRRAVRIFEFNCLVLQAQSNSEDRKLAIGELDEVMIAVVFTLRGSATRLITARRARKYEREAYETQVVRRNSENEG